MLRTLLSLLAVLPMLVPSGLCVCQFAPGRAADSSASKLTANAESCPCCASHAERESDSSEPSSPDDNHCPNCPAVLGVATATALPAAPVLAPDAVAASPLITEPVVVATHSNNRFDTSFVCASAPPLFVCHCSLLI
jgi:hypothetical protein